MPDVGLTHVGCGFNERSPEPWCVSTQVVVPGAERIVKGEGMPISKRPGEKGDLRIKMSVEFPQRQVTDPEETTAIMKILGSK